MLCRTCSSSFYSVQVWSVDDSSWKYGPHKKINCTVDVVFSVAWNVSSHTHTHIYIQERANKISDYFRQLLSQRVKQGGANLRDPAKFSVRLHQSSSEACATLVVSLKEDERLNSLAHAQWVRQASASARKERVHNENNFVAGMMASSSEAIKKRLGRIGQTVTWMT